MKRRSFKRTSKLSRPLRGALALFIVFTLIAIGPARKVAAFIVPSDGGTGVSSTINISGVTAPIVTMEVRLTFDSPIPDELDMLLVAPDGMSNLEFMSDVGGSLAFSGTITLSDSGMVPVPNAGPLVSGNTYQPADDGGTETGASWGLSPLLPINHATTEGSATFTGVNGAFTNLAEPNGIWTLYVRDDEMLGGDTNISQWALMINGATAADGVISGHTTTADGAALGGATVKLSGTQSRKTITNTNGNYRFDNVETNGFYTVTPARANYSFSPASRNFSQLGANTEATFTAASTGESTNPLETAEYFVRQQYVDLLGREPDEGGFNYWSERILECGSDTSCVNARRRSVAAAFFIEAEFQQSGSFIYGLYKASLGRRPAYAEFSSDRQQVVAGANLEAAKQAFAEGFVQRTEFSERYQANATAESFVDALLVTVSQASGVDLSSQRASLISKYNAGANLNQSRSLVVRDVIDNAGFRQAEYNRAFVLAEYFGYLQRDPDQGGYDFWLNVLNNRDVGNYQGMVCAFISSAEYQRRFSSIVSHTDSECGQ